MVLNAMTKVRIAVAFFTFGLNSVLIVGTTRNATLRKLRSSRHVISVCFAHIVFALSFGVAAYTNHIDGMDVLDDLLILGSLVYFYNIITFTVDRYLAICRPFVYMRVSKLLQWLLVLSTWVLAIGYYLLQKFYYPSIGESDAQLLGYIDIGVINGSLLVTLAVVIILNSFIFRAVIRSKRKAKQMSVTNVSEIGTNEGRKKNAIISSDLRAAYGCFGAAVTLFLSKTPYMIFWAIGPYYKYADEDEMTEEQQNKIDVISDVLYGLANLDSIFDPVCFLYFNTKLQADVKNLFMCRKSPRPTADSISSS